MATTSWPKVPVSRLLWVLDDAGRPVRAHDLLEWCAFMADEDGRDRRRVALAAVGPLTVSTVFLGMDHAPGAGRPVLFETMIFGAQDAEYVERYHTRAQAEAGHAVAVKIAERYVAGHPEPPAGREV